MPSYSGTFRAVVKALGLGIACAIAPGAWVIGNHGAGPKLHVMAASTPNFVTDVTPILRENCLSCHSATTHKSGLAMDSYGELMKGGRHGQTVVPHDAKASRLIQMLDGDIDPQMPDGADPLPAAEIAILRAWINAGAEGPAADAASRPIAAATIPDIRPEVRVSSPVSSVKFSPDGKLVAVGGFKMVRLIEATTGAVVASLGGHVNYVRSLAFSPDGQLVAAAGGAPHSDGEIKIWDVHSHALVRTIKGHKDCIYSIAWSPDGKLLASGSYDKMVKIWEVASGKELLNLQDHIDAVFAVAFSPDGKRLASASQDRTVKIWNVVTGRRLYSLSDALDGLTSISYSPGGEQIAAVGYDKTIYVWKLAEEDGHLTRSLIADQDSILALVWAPDGRIVTASSDGSIRFRDNSLEMLSVLDKQTDWVQALDISSDGLLLAAGRYDGTLSLYNAKSYKEVRKEAMTFDPIDPIHPIAAIHPKVSAIGIDEKSASKH